MIESCTRVRAAVAYASRDNMLLFGACVRHLKPLEFFGRYDHTVAVDPAALKWFLDKASPNFVPYRRVQKLIRFDCDEVMAWARRWSQEAKDQRIEAKTDPAHKYRSLQQALASLPA